jgi:hypothetical protein
MREIHGQVDFLIACHTTRHQGRVWCIQGLLYRTAVRRYRVFGTAEVFTETRASPRSENDERMLELGLHFNDST